MRASPLVCAVLSAVSLLAQEAPETVFRTGTRLVQVDVVVRAKNKQVLGLTKDDFEIYDNGKPQDIAVFAERHMPPPDTPQRKIPPGVVMNRPIQDGTEPVSSTVILLDGGNTKPEDQANALQELLRGIDRAQRREAIAVYQLGTTLKLLATFSDNHEILRETIRTLRAAQPLDLVDEEPIDNAAAAVAEVSFQRRVDRTVAAFRAIARQLKDIPGRKKLVWITAGIPLTMTITTVRNGTPSNQFIDMSERLLGPIAELNDANVGVYPIDPRGGKLLLTPEGLADPSLTIMIRYADRTGGVATYGENFVDGPLGRALADTDVTYTLGFYLLDEKYDGAKHSLRVRLKHGGAELRYRNSYNNEAKPPVLTKASREATVNAWMQEPVDATAIPLAAYAAPIPNRPGFVEVQLTIDPAALKLEHANGRFNGRIQLAIAPDIGSKAKGLRQTITLRLTEAKYIQALESGMAFVHQVRANPAKNDGSMPKRMRIVVLDETTGKAGSVRVPIATP